MNLRAPPLTRNPLCVRQTTLCHACTRARCCSVCIEPALASGGRYTVVGGTARHTAEVKTALNASRFDWSLVPEQITIHVVPGKDASSTPGHIWLSQRSEIPLIAYLASIDQRNRCAQTPCEQLLT